MRRKMTEEGVGQCVCECIGARCWPPAKTQHIVSRNADVTHTWTVNHTFRRRMKRIAPFSTPSCSPGRMTDDPR